MDEIAELKKIRKKIGITQNELAKRANVSQSLIAKIESSKIDPSYKNVKKLFETLSMLDKGNELTAKQLMFNKIYFVSDTDKLKDAILKMRKHNISQMPVMKNKKVIGYISESVLLDKVLEGETQSNVGEIMESSPPILPPNTSQGVIANLLQHFPFVLIEEKGELIGIVTKADLLKVMYK
jgi:predicted transcriptional regulator